VIIQAGVGGLAAAICAAFWMKLGDRLPRFIIVESEHSDCIAESFRQNRAASVEVATETMMAGLSCGEISLIAWEILSRGVSHITAISDQAVAPAMRAMAAGELGDSPIESGECAVPGIITLLAAAGDDNLRTRYGLDAQSRILVFGCEGATDRAIYDRILAGAAS
jgi:diaminopropionate ammonia-lyase